MAASRCHRRTLSASFRAFNHACRDSASVRVREFRNLLADQAKEEEEERVVKRWFRQRLKRASLQAFRRQRQQFLRIFRDCFKCVRRTCRQKTRTYCSKQGSSPLPWSRLLCTGRLWCSMEGTQDGCIYNYVVSAHKPTAVRHSVVGNFTSPSDLNLIIRHALYHASTCTCRFFS